jgi:chromosome segregation ATPase
MTEPNAIETASRRLALALDALTAAVERRRGADEKEETLAAQLHALGSDRVRLASELDEAAARLRSFENVNREVGRRLDAATESIRALLALPER